MLIKFYVIFRKRSRFKQHNIDWYKILEFRLCFIDRTLLTLRTQKIHAVKYNSLIKLPYTVYIYIYICVCVCIYIYIYIYTYIYLFIRGRSGQQIRNAWKVLKCVVLEKDGEDQLDRSCEK